MCGDIGRMEASNRPAWSDALIGGALACVLTAAWSLIAWSDLSALRLPDADDVMRLQQIRDWLDGQAFSDLTQYRLGAGGVAMHWSRLADIVPAAIVASLQGVTGRHQAELAAVIAWPALLLAAAIALTGRITRGVAGGEAAVPAMIVAAIVIPPAPCFCPAGLTTTGFSWCFCLEWR